MSFSERTLALLRKAGWSENRSIDTTALEAALSDAGYPVFPCVREFFRQFGDLSITIPAPSPQYASNYMNFGRWFKGFVNCRDFFANYPDWNVPLCVIGGDPYEYHYILLMDSEGRIYEDSEYGNDDITLIADNANVLVERMLGTTWKMVGTTWTRVDPIVKTED